MKTSILRCSGEILFRLSQHWYPLSENKHLIGTLVAGTTKNKEANWLNIFKLFSDHAKILTDYWCLYDSYQNNSYP